LAFVNDSPCEDMEWASLPGKRHGLVDVGDSPVGRRIVVRVGLHTAVPGCQGGDERDSQRDSEEQTAGEKLTVAHAILTQRGPLETWDRRVAGPPRLVEPRD
jgi:hypothetical protein